MPASTAGPASHSCQLQRVIFIATLPALDNRRVNPSSVVTGTVSDLPQQLLSHPPHAGCQVGMFVPVPHESDSSWSLPPDSTSCRAQPCSGFQNLLQSKQGHWNAHLSPGTQRYIKHRRKESIEKAVRAHFSSRQWAKAALGPSSTVLSLKSRARRVHT